MKLVGAALVVLAGTCLGVAGALRLRQRPLDLDRLAGALDVLSTEIGHGLVPLPAALERAAAATRGSTGRVFAVAAREVGAGMQVADAWTKAVKDALPYTALTRSDADILMSLGSVLGRSLRDDQLRHVALARDRLAGACREARDEAHRGEKLRVYLGLLGAVALVLVLW